MRATEAESEIFTFCLPDCFGQVQCLTPPTEEESEWGVRTETGNDGQQRASWPLRLFYLVPKKEFINDEVNISRARIKDYEATAAKAGKKRKAEADATEEDAQDPTDAGKLVGYNGYSSARARSAAMSSDATPNQKTTQEDNKGAMDLKKRAKHILR